MGKRRRRPRAPTESAIRRRGLRGGPAAAVESAKERVIKFSFVLHAIVLPTVSRNGNPLSDSDMMALGEVFFPLMRFVVRHIGSSERACVVACQVGAVGVLRCAVKLARRDFISREVSNLFRVCCKYHRSDAAKWLVHNFRLRWIGFTVDDYVTFIGLCEYGYFDMAKLMTRLCPMSPAIVKSEKNWAFTTSCGQGHLDIAKWLASTFGLTAEDARDDDNAALRLSCSHGHLHVAKWLVDTFNLGPADARARCNFALRMSCQHGYLDCAKFLAETFHLGREDAIDNNNDALRSCCDHGHLDVAKWMTQEFNLCQQDALARGEYNALYYSCGSGHFDVAAWLVEKFDLRVTHASKSILDWLHKADDDAGNPDARAILDKFELRK